MKKQRLPIIFDKFKIIFYEEYHKENIKIALRNKLPFSFTF